ncbi:hypothetical protein K466DRAFT_547216 [Polyporus arcularius HHB13444]|uniref:LIM-domain binding protein n=1 Tax=Polyporus arcularius HHB13444 TaxID=1314778 RepID=A0A5C3PH68_9APHY|nr:hypothetical protein K466DRAFT_547216 [Polyporus arcularius HHB13444]
MNVPHPDMLRGGVPNMHPGLMGQQYMQPQPQQGQQTMPHNMALLQNTQGGNPGLGLMGGQPGASNPNYPLSMQPGRRPVYMGQHPNGPALNPAGGAGPSHMAGLAPSQLQSMAGLAGTNMQAIRRVQSQPMVGQAGAHGMPGMQPGIMAGGMGMNGQPVMNAMRGMTQQQMQMQMQMRQHQQSSSQGGGMSPESMGLPMGRAGQMQGANGLPPHARTASGQQLMPPLGQPQTHPHAHGIPQSMQHNAFANSMSMPHQHQHQQSPGQQQPNMAGGMAGNPMPPQQTGPRAQMSPDNSMFMNYQNPPMQPQLPRMQMNSMGNAHYNMVPSPAPHNPGGDMPQRGPSMDASGPLTPAQVIGMGGGGEGFASGSYGMGPGAGVPPRPPSHNGPHAGFSMSQSQPNLPTQHSPRPPQMHPSTGVPRPQSQPQAVHRQSPIPRAPSRTPRVSQASIPVSTSGMPPPARIPPPPSSQSPQGPSHPPAQSPATAPPGTHSMQIAPRPGTGSGAPAGIAGPTASTSSAPSPAQPATAPERRQPTPAPAPAHAPAPAPAPAPVPAPAPGPATAPAQIGPQSTRQSSIYPVGFGQCFGRILQFSGQLAQDNNERLKMSYWNRVVQMYFSEKATIKLTLWKDNQQVEAKPFEIAYPIFPRFFCVTAQSGVKSQTITIDGARERLINPSRAIVECPNAAWTFRYTNGYSITLRGPFTAEIIVQPGANPPPPRSAGMPAIALNYDLMFERLQFDAFFHDKYIAFDSIVGERIPDSPRIMPSPTGNPNGADEAGRYDPTRYEEPRYLIDHAIIPAEPINAFGIPQATMRCLELAESVAQMSDLIHFSVSNKMGPVDALSAYADKIRRERALGGGPLGPNGVDGFAGNGAGPSPFPEGPNGVPAQALGPSTSFGTPGNMPGPSHAPPPVETQGASQGEGASKQAKAAPQPPQASGSTPVAQASTPASAPTPGGPTTPSMANASLKRKAPPARSGEDSPTTAHTDQPPAKKNARKRGRTQGS